MGTDMKKMLFSAAALIVLSSAVYAADLPSKKMAPVMAAAPLAFSWTGAYVGGQIGYGWGRDALMDQVKTSAFSDYSGSNHPHGVQGGLYAGYNMQSGNLVYGLEIDGVLSAARSSVTPPFAYDVRTKINADGALRGRIGFAVDRALFYVAGGVSVASFKADHVAKTLTDSFNVSRAGWTLGAGAEYAFDAHWIGRAEYRYSQYGRFKNYDVAVDSGWLWKNRVSQSEVRVGVAYKF